MARNNGMAAQMEYFIHGCAVGALAQPLDLRAAASNHNDLIGKW